MIEISFDEAKETIGKFLITPEGHRLEFKRVSGKMVSKALDTICAFANSEGGSLVLGVADNKQENGNIRLYGVEENPEALDELLRKISSQFMPPIPADNILLLRVACRLRDNTDGHIVVVHVLQSGKVHSVIDGNTLCRMRASNRPMTAVEITELSYRRGIRSAEAEPIFVDWSLLETPVWDEFSSARGFGRSRPLPEQMAQLGLALRVEDALRPTRAAVLLFADEPGGLLAAHGSRAEVRLMVYRGKSVEAAATPNFRKPPRVFRGPLVRLIEETVRAVLDELAQGVELENSGFKTRHRYPERVVKEAIVNAVLHRDYRLNRDILIRIFDDRLEIESPGVFPGSITPANIKTAGSNARNPLIVRTLRDFPKPPNFDLNEGVPMMFEQMDAAHLYPPQYRQNSELMSECVVVTLLNAERPSIWNEVSDWVERRGPIANADLCKISKIDTLRASKLLRIWVEQGLLEPLPGRAKRNMAYIKTGRSVEQVELLSGVLDNKLRNI
ncbi:MAG: ATP-binding protein [Alphaproteobacteria bacterium]|nr:ATP-binding protein [Alphaproteobacteria bacterium]